jgi:hypothetical protein
MEPLASLPADGAPLRLVSLMADNHAFFYRASEE